MDRFANTFRLMRTTTILDVGGGLFNWTLIGQPAQVTILNIREESDQVQGGQTSFSFVLGSGLALPYADQSFDIVYSNSVIEHLGDRETQRWFAREVMRVGKSLWIQTPDKYFFVEPHYVTPFIHYLPRSIQRRILRNFSVWGLVARPSQQYIDGFLNEVRLLSGREMAELFPQCQIVRERFLFFTKSLIAVRVLGSKACRWINP